MDVSGSLRSCPSTRALRYLSGLYQQASQHLKPGGDIEIAGANLATDAIYIPNAPKDSYGSIFVAIQSAV